MEIFWSSYKKFGTCTIFKSFFGGPTQNLLKENFIEKLYPRQSRTAMKAMTEDPIPEATPKVLGKSDKGIYTAFYYQSDNQRQKVLVPMENDHFR